MTISFRPAARENVPLLLGLAGGTGSGKTWSALELATGIADGQRFAVIDTENGRARHYADDFQFDVAELHAPFRPQAYADAIQAADAKGYPVIVVDSASHEWAGDGGCLDWHDEIMGGDQTKKLMAWIQPKQAHRRMVTQLLQVKAHVVLCFRAEAKVEMVKNDKGKWEIVEKKSLTGLDGWMPISEKNLPFELTASFLLMADQPGVPKPIKLPERLRSFVPLDRPLTAEAGRALAGWAAGSSGEREAAVTAGPSPDDYSSLLSELFAVTDELGTDRSLVEESVAKHVSDVAWLKRQIVTARKNLAAKQERDGSPFQVPGSVTA